MRNELATNLGHAPSSRVDTLVSPRGNLHTESRLIATVLSPDAASEFASNFSRKWELTHMGMQDDDLFRVRFALGNGIRTKKPSVDGSDPVNYVRGLFEQKPKHLETREDTTPAALNIPNPDFFEITSGEGTKIDSDTVVRTFNMRHATLRTAYDTRDSNGNVTSVESTEFLSQTDPHMSLVRYKITPHYTGKMTVETGIDGRVNNGQITGPNGKVKDKRMSFYNGEERKVLPSGEGVQYIVGTKYKKHEIASTQKITVSNADGSEEYSPQAVSYRKRVAQRVEIDAVEGQAIIVDKWVSVRTDVDQENFEGVNDGNAEHASRAELKAAGSFDELLGKHKDAWEKIWGKVELNIDGDDEVLKILRFNKAHLLTEVRPGYDRAGMSPKKGPKPWEGYKGHAFWDGEIFDMNVMTQEQALTMLSYRHRLLDAARYKARDYGYEGAFWPWEAQFADDSPEFGEACPAWVLNELGIRVPIEARDEEIHISADIAFATMEHFWMSNNEDFLRNNGSEMIIEAARFYKSRSTEVNGRYEFHGVTGPDEYHWGVKNDAYTNIMAKWTVLQAIKLARDGQVDQDVIQRMGLGEEEFEAEIAGLTDFADKIYIPFDLRTLIFNKFDGWEDVKKIDLNSSEYRGIKAMDERLRKESSAGKDPATLTPDEIGPVRKTDVIKQHDILLALSMLGESIMDILPADVLRQLRETGKSDAEIVSSIFKANYDEYYPKTCDGSSLSPNKGVEVSLMGGVDPDKIYSKFKESVAIDYGVDTHHTADGIHTAAIGGAEQAVVAGFAGIKVTADALLINPRLPSHWRSFARNMYYRGHPIRIEIDQMEGKVVVNLLDRSSRADFVVRINGENVQFKPEDEGALMLFLNDNKDRESKHSVPQVIFSAPTN